MSRLRSARGASRTPARTAGGRPGVFLQTPRSDIFVLLLSIALGAIVLGCLLLILVLNRYDFSTKAAALNPPAATTVVSLGHPPCSSVILSDCTLVA